ncbi:hypothetical protein OC834_002535 [Tilletia horrida]|uniref:Uncharacterized protein n=1 Tax=Tilletia horrida TaxID=155126 RepID=A0AAN6GJ21_9BASI|nr:hypothetical protein OC834_002535 [Tilletia horrida]KAK0539756.1 hypothetical protein OC842_000796 [Tilletia horrida]
MSSSSSAAAALLPPITSSGDDPWSHYTAPFHNTAEHHADIDTIDAAAAPPTPTTKTRVSDMLTPRPSSRTVPTTTGAASTSAANMTEAEAVNAVARLCSTGPLAAVQDFFASASAEPPAGAGISAFALANEPHPTTGLVPLHYAAKEGRLDIVRWLVSDAGAMVDLEDRDGETALHKAALAGKLPVCTFLLANDASAEATDSDGWTPLHNACSRGYLDIVRLLVEQAEVSVNSATVPRGWTPLMNAASKGHLPIVRYLTSKYHADPFIRNSAGETAYDVAASTFEVYICEVLEKYEAERWSALKYAEPASAPQPNGSSSSTTRRLRDIGAYNPLALHTTVPVIIHENQRLDTRLSTLAIHGGKPRWSSSGAARKNVPDRRAPSSITPGPLSRSKTRHLAVTKEDVLLPLRDEPYKMRYHTLQAARANGDAAAAAAAAGGAPSSADLSRTPTSAADFHGLNGGSNDAPGSGPITASEPSHFWLSDWQLDYSHPMVSIDDSSTSARGAAGQQQQQGQSQNAANIGGGWQYAPSFDTPEERWVAEMPAPLVRLLEGKGLGSSVSRAVASGAGALPIIGSGSNSNSNSNNSADEREATAPGAGWVRRRRWVRVMRRRLDIEFGDELEAAERIIVSSSSADPSSSLSENLSPAALRAQDIARSEAARLGSEADYVARARTLAGQAVAMGGTPADMLGQSKDETDARTARLELAVAELRASAFSDGSAERRARAEELLKEYMVQLGQMRQASGIEDEDEDDDSEADDDEEFIYPNSYKDDAASVITRLAPSSSSGFLYPGSSAATAAASSLRPAILDRVASSASVFGPNVTPSEAGTSAAALRSADLAAAREFRVPTHDAPNRHVMQANRAPVLREQNLTPQWESDAAAAECRGCSRRFTFFLRKHHCRRCGRIFCDACSSHRAHLSPQELVVDPAIPEMFLHEAVSAARICNSCNAERQLPANLRSRFGGGGTGAEAALLRNGGGAGPGRNGGVINLNGRSAGGYDGFEDEVMGPPSDVSSRASELNECPVCDKALASLGDSSAQEAHVRSCLENGGGGSLQGGRYLVYKLPDGSPIVSKECVICMEDFVVGATIARLPCLCYFHRACIDSWFKKGRACPVHARTW